MKLLFPFIIFLVGVLPVAAQQEGGIGLLRAYIHVDSSVQGTDQRDFFTETEALVRELKAEEKGKKIDERLLAKVFFLPRKDFLKTYQPDAGASDLMDKGEYNCLSATIFYAAILEELHIPYSIVETNYHVFLLVKGKRKAFLFETTDAINGFVHSPQLISLQLQYYQNQNLVNEETLSSFGSQQDYLGLQSQVYHEINSSQLLGLVYYNKSVEAYNQKAFESALNYLWHSWERHPSPRLSEVASIMLNAWLQEEGIIPGKTDYYMEKFNATFVETGIRLTGKSR
jgi:hypothetical protein